MRETDRSSRRPSWRGLVTLFAAIAGTALSALILSAILVLPTVRTIAASSAADGTRAYGVGSGYEMPTEGAFAIVTPETGWTVQPDRSGSGLVVLSPDRVLFVHLESMLSGETEEILDSVGGPLLTEALASGLDLSHASSGQVFVGVFEHEPAERSERVLLVEAEVAAGADPERYRPALAGLLESITIG